MKLDELVRSTFLPPVGKLINSNNPFSFRIEKDGDKFIPTLIQGGLYYFIYDCKITGIAANALSEYKNGCYKKADALKLCWDFFERHRKDNIYNESQYKMEPLENNEA